MPADCEPDAILDLIGQQPQQPFSNDSPQLLPRAFLCHRTALPGNNYAVKQGWKNHDFLIT